MILQLKEKKMEIQSEELFIIIAIASIIEKCL